MENGPHGIHTKDLALSKRRRPDKLLQLTSEGFKWRKYGRKTLMDKSCVRSYYKCNHSNITKCPAKKIVDVRDDDYTRIQVSYLQQHNHPKIITSTNDNDSQCESDESLSQESASSDGGQKYKAAEHIGDFDAEIFHRVNLEEDSPSICTEAWICSEGEASVVASFSPRNGLTPWPVPHGVKPNGTHVQNGDRTCFDPMSLLGGRNTESVADYMDFSNNAGGE